MRYTSSHSYSETNSTVNFCSRNSVVVKQLYTILLKSRGALVTNISTILGEISFWPLQQVNGIIEVTNSVLQSR